MFSILVFVDLALEVVEPPDDSSAGAGFNPCFRGSSSRSLFLPEDKPPNNEVSILVFVDLALEGQL